MCNTHSLEVKGGENGHVFPAKVHKPLLFVLGAVVMLVDVAAEMAQQHVQTLAQWVCQ